MVYLIDYENVANDGLNGYEFLTSQDTLYLFYSECVHNIRKQISLKIFHPSMDVHLYKLRTPRKNAIDFYIASKLGELIESRQIPKAAIVTKDQGFQSIVDFWGHVSEKKCTVILGKSISECILKSGNNDEQYRQVKYHMMSVPLENLYSEYERQKELEEKVKDQLAGTEFEEECSKVIDIFAHADSKKGLYLSLLKKFGRERGTRLYASIKNIENTRKAII